MIEGRHSVVGCPSCFVECLLVNAWSSNNMLVVTVGLRNSQWCQSNDANLHIWKSSDDDQQILYLVECLHSTTIF